MADVIGNLWQKVFSKEEQDRFIETVSGHMGNCTDKEIIKRQITIFREVSPDIAERLEKELGVKGEQTIEGIVFNGTHNGFGIGKKKGANGLPLDHVNFDNGAPRPVKA